MTPPRSAGLAAYLALTVLADVVAPAILRLRQRRGKEDPARLGERLGRPGQARPNGPLIWFHAASVGESLSLLTLIGQILDARRDAQVLITSGTRTSAALLSDRLPPRCLHQFAPLDTRRAVARFLDHWRPDLAVWTESELWPRLVHATHARGIPMLLINARMSATSARRWGRAGRMPAALLARFDHVLTQDEALADVVRRFGLPAERVEAVGTLKEETAALPAAPETLKAIRAAIAGRQCWLAASTHPGEDEIVADAHRRLLADDPDLLLIIAPRHPARGDAVETLLAARRLGCSRRSAGALPKSGASVYLADTLGEMGVWYRVAPVAFVGGSLVPVGGHNPYEPAALGAAILTGPHVENFADIFARLLAAGGAEEVHDAGQLAAAVARLRAPGAAARRTAAAREVCTAAGTATERARALILDRLPASDLRAPDLPSEEAR